MADARKYLTLPGRFEMYRGGVLLSPTFAYETWGELNAG
ncbi:MAG TPA: homoserine O-acetyltransferase, partial [Chromatiales bacterium]|nr:homoserine O-acetyltransferase [Chromatiales bacterium]